MKKTLPDELVFLQNRKAIQRTTQESMKGKVVIITGSTSGVGYQAAKRLAQGGAHLVMINRNIEKSHKIQKELIDHYGVEVDSFIADFTQLETIKKVAKDILNLYPKIDVLINCAGMHSTKKTWTKDGFETVFCVNHLAPFLLTQLLLPRLQQSAPARIIQVNSEGHRFNGLRIDDLNWKKRIYTGLRGYGASKTAQLMTVWELADQLQSTGVTINAMHPGDVKTNIGRNNGWLYRLWSHLVINRLLDDPSKSGDALYYLAAAKEMNSMSGKFFHLTIEEKPAKHALNRDLGKKIYEASMKMVGL